MPKINPVITAADLALLIERANDPVIGDRTLGQMLRRLVLGGTPYGESKVAA